MTGLLAVRDLTVQYGGSPRPAIEDVNLSIVPGEVVGVVGESGSGKSTLGTAILGLLPKGASTSGSVTFEGAEVVGASEKVMRPLRGAGLSTIMQNASTALNPSFTIGDQFTTLLRKRRGLSRPDAHVEAVDWLQRVGLPSPSAQLRAYPHTLSGGMNQRVAIAMSLALHPKLVVADEPTSALDVTVQAAVLRLLRDLVADANSAMLLVTHDLGVVAQLCGRLIVMNAGSVVETGAVVDVFAHARDSCTQRLLASLPGRQPSPTPCSSRASR